VRCCGIAPRGRSPILRFCRCSQTLRGEHTARTQAARHRSFADGGRALNRAAVVCCPAVGSTPCDLEEPAAGMNYT